MPSASRRLPTSRRTGRSSRRRPTVTGATLVGNTDIAPRIGVSSNLSGKGQTVLKGFWGRYYNNLADGFSSANPGGTNYAEYNFLDQNRNNRYDGPSELGSLRLRIGGASSLVNEDLKTPHTDEISGSLEHQFWGESSARFTYVRKNQYDFVPFYTTPLVTAWQGQEHCFDACCRRQRNVYAARRAVVDCRPDEYLVRQLAGRRLPLRHHRVRVQQAVQRPLLRPDQSRSHLAQRAASRLDISNFGSTSPLATDPIAVGPQLTVNPAAPNRQESTMYHLPAVGALHVPGGYRIALNYRMQSGFPYSRIIDESVSATPTLNVCNFECTFFVENIDPESIGSGEPDELPRRQGVHHRQVEVHGDARHLQPAQRRSGHQLQPVSRTTTSG